MATQRLRSERIGSATFASVRDILALFGIAEREDYGPVEDDILKAIRAHGWEPSVERETDPPGWKAEITEWRSVSQSQTAVAHDPDRTTAVLRALRRALSWPSPEEDVRAFEEQTQSLLGLSADEFLEKWRANELSADDPRIVHLLIARPLGW
ncbi:MAG: hypothetical protein ACRDJH_23975 [Thermomicrobiales bacterium]